MALPTELNRIKFSIERRSEHGVSAEEMSLLHELRVLDDFIPLEVLRQKIGEIKLTAPASGTCRCCGQDLPVGP